MSRFISYVCRSVDGTIQSFGPQQWAIVAMALVVLGFFCMRGFGSQKSY